ncbi:MAG TPA: type IV pilus twitching motility protein PilT [Polyangia bacterium]|nr:type IV pilus twitching motility protein PilT [Polyangia bacterium]
MNQILDHVLGAARQLGASDVHLKSGLPPVFRIKGDLRTLRDTPPLTADVIGTFAVNLMNDKQRQQFDIHHDADLSYGTPDGVRYRVNVFKQRGQTGMVLRIIPPEVPGFDRLNLPPAVQKMCEEERGLILVTGITGSGKSTTLAAMIDHINRQRASHIITVEDPIEFMHRDRRSVVNQREIGFDAESFSSALRAALRQDPDVILVGEMRDEETIETALHAAETGHLVMSTLHTLDAVETVNRIIGMFTPHQQQQIRLALAAVLKGVVSQRLVARADGKGMVPAVEIMVMTGRVRELLEDPKRTREIRDAIANGRNPYGMMTFDQCLADLVMRQLITYETALSSSTTPDDFALQFRGVSKGDQQINQAGAQRQEAQSRDAGDIPLELDRKR